MIYHLLYGIHVYVLNKKRYSWFLDFNIVDGMNVLSEIFIQLQKQIYL